MNETATAPSESDAAQRSSSAEPASAGSELSIEQLAAVQAGLQDDFELVEILQLEGIDEQVWHKGRAEHLERIARDADTFERYQAALEAHQDRLQCAVDPLYDDVTAWVAFVMRADTTTASKLCSELGITAGDMARLERHWKRKLQEDPAMAKQARRLREEPSCPALPALEVGERSYVPLGGAAPDREEQDGEVHEVSEPAGAADTGPCHDDDLDRMAALQAYMTEGIDFGILQLRYHLASRAEATRLLESYRETLAADRQQLSHYRTRVEHFRRLAAARQQGHPPSQPDSAPQRSPSMPAASRLAELTPHDIDTTGAVDSVLVGLAPLPFLDGAPVVMPPPAAPPAELDSDQAGETGILDLAQIQLPATPFTPPSSPPPSSIGEGSVDDTAVLDPELIAQLAALPAVPFHGSAPAPPAGRAGADEQAEHDGPPSSTVGDTGFLDLALLGQLPSPFGAPTDDPTEPQSSASGSTGHLEQLDRYASYCVELEERSDQQLVCARYGVESSSHHRQLHAQWSARLAADEDLQARFQAATDTYRRWLRTTKPESDS